MLPSTASGTVKSTRAVGLRLLQDLGQIVPHVYLRDQPQVRLRLHGGDDLLPHAPLRAGNGDGNAHAFFLPFFVLPFWKGPTVAMAYWSSPNRWWATRATSSSVTALILF